MDGPLYTCSGWLFDVLLHSSGYFLNSGAHQTGDFVSDYADPILDNEHARNGQETSTKKQLSDVCFDSIHCTQFFVYIVPQRAQKTTHATYPVSTSFELKILSSLSTNIILRNGG